MQGAPLSPSGFDSKDLVLLNIQQSQKPDSLTELHKINKYFNSSVICASLRTYSSYKVMCYSPAIQAKLGVLIFPRSPLQVIACSRLFCVERAYRSQHLKGSKVNSCSNNANPGGPGCSDQTPHSRGATTTVGTAGPVSVQIALRTLVLAIKGPSPEGKWHFCSEFFNQAAPVVQSLGCHSLFVTPWTVAHQAPLSMGFSRQGYWSGLPFASPWDLSDPGIEPSSPMSPAVVGGFFTSLAIREA